MVAKDDRWFQHFVVEPDDGADGDAIWDDQFTGPKLVRKPTRAEKLSIVLVGVLGIGLIALMIATLVIAVYLSRN